MPAALDDPEFQRVERIVFERQMQKCLLDRGLFSGLRLSVTERIQQRGLYLPSGAALTDQQIGLACEVVSEILA